MRAAFTTCLLVVAVSFANAQDWPQWRGPTGDNHAADGATAPVAWSETEGLAWKTPVPGRGHSSPTIVGDRIYLTTADTDAGTQSLLVFNKTTGEMLKQTLTHEGGLPERIHPSNTHASPTVASDGERVFALFCNQDSAYVTAYDLDGEKLWQERVAGFKPAQFEFGFGSSPRIVDGLVIFASEYDGAGSGIFAVDAKTGETAWDTPRTEKLSYSSPAVATLGGRDVLLMSGNYNLASYDAKTGEELWKVDDVTARATCGTMVWDESLGLAFASGGFPDAFTLAVRLDGDHEVVWQNGSKCYEQSLLLADGYVYAATDRGVAFCWRATDGEEMWRERLGGKYSSSPVLVGGTIYVTNEGGVTHAFEANPERFVRLGENRLGDSGFATPTPADGRLYHRYGKNEGGKLQEYLTAIGE